MNITHEPIILIFFAEVQNIGIFALQVKMFHNDVTPLIFRTFVVADLKFYMRKIHEVDVLSLKTLTKTTKYAN